MASSVPFAFDVDKLNRFVNGDIGIADLIHKIQIAPILNTIPTKKDKDIFFKLQEPNRKAGLWAVEKSVISTMLDSQKPFIELAKICLEMFGALEQTITILIGGPNPLNKPDSFAGANALNKDKMATFKTGMEPDPVPPGEEPIPPPNIFLGKYFRNNALGNVSPLNSGPEKGEFYPGFYLQQYQNFQQFNDSENAKLQKDIADVPEDIKPDIIDGRFQSIGDEWSEMDSENQLRKKYNLEFGFGNNMLKYFIPTKVQYLNKEVEIDVETDYDISVIKTNNVDNNGAVYQDFYISAVLKPEAGPVGIGQKAQPLVFPGNNLVWAVKTFLKKALPVIIKKLIPVIVAIQKLLSKPVEFIGGILMEKLKEYFEMFDPTLKNKPEDDKDRQKYWSGNKFVMDGVAALDIGLMKITLGLKDGIPSFKVGKDAIPPNTNEQPILKQVANLAALPINFLKGVFDSFKNLLKNLFNIKKLPSVVSDFISFKWIKDLMSLEKMLEFLGAKNGDLSTIPFLSIPKSGATQLVPGMIQAFLKMIVNFINGFIGIPNTILNIQLVPTIPMPA